jgi:hypothetical protein
MNYWIGFFFFLNLVNCFTGQPMVDLHDHIFRMCEETCQRHKTYFSSMYLPLSFHFQDTPLRPQAFFQCLCCENEIEKLTAQTTGTVYKTSSWCIIDVTPHVHKACQQQVGSRYNKLFRFYSLQFPDKILFLCNHYRHRNSFN